MWCLFQVSAVDEEGKLYEWDEKSETYAVYNSLPRQHAYSFSITAKNAHGRSPEASIITMARDETGKFAPGH